MPKRSDTTKDLFLIEALRLFSKNGYEAVSVSQIADAVGCSAPALYKHYPNKQALFEAIVERSMQDFSSRMDRFGVGFSTDPSEIELFLKMSESEQIEVLKQLFLRTLEDEFPTLFRKLITVEQFMRPELAVIYNKRYVDCQIDSFTSLMDEAIRLGFYKNGDSRSMAFQYISPIIIYIAVCDREPERKEEALKTIESNVIQFNRLYRLN